MIGFFFVIALLTGQGHCGNDTFGYYFLDSDTSSGPEFLWIEPEGAETLSMADDDNSLITLPFPFPFYHSTLRQIFVVSNGYMTSTNTRTAANLSLPVGSLNNLIAPFWDDLDPGSGGRILTFYDSLMDVFVVLWENVPHYRSGGPYTFEVILFRNGNIAFSYLNLGAPRNSATAGIQGSNGENGFFLPYIYNGNPFEPHDSLTVMFYRPTDLHIIDVSPTVFVFPDTMIIPSGSQLSVEVEVLNGSTDTVTTSVNLLVRMLPQDTVIYSGIQTLLGFSPYSLDTAVFTIPFSLSEGFYEISVYTTTQGDTNYTNDTLTCSVIVPDTTENFEENGGNFVSSTGWEWGTATVGPQTAHSGTKLWGTVLNGNYSNRADYQLIGRFVAVDSFAAFGFFHWFETERRMDGGNVSVSINSDSSWFVVHPERGYPSMVFPIGDEGFTGISDGWQDAVFRLDSLSPGDTVYIMLRFKSGRSNTAPGWYVDDFSYLGLDPVPFVEVNEDVMSPDIYFSNTVVNGRLSLMIGDRASKEVKVFNVAGREVMKVKVRPGLNNINISGLESGIYFIRISGRTVRFLVLK